MSSRTLQHFIDTHNLQAQILKMSQPTPTVPSAAEVLGIEVEQVIKSLVFETPDGPVLVVGCGLARIDTKLLAIELECSKGKVKFASPNRALQITGYVVGSMPPFGHLQPLPTYIDGAVMDHETLYGGGGDTDAMLRLSRQELLDATAGKVLLLQQV